MIAECLKLAAVLILPVVQCQPLSTESTLYAHSSAGYLSAYGQMPTDATLAHRIETGQIAADAEYDILVAVYDCRLIGRRAELHTVIGSFDALVFDCANDADGGQAWMKSGQYVAEIDWYAWQTWPALVGSWATLEIIE